MSEQPINSIHTSCKSCVFAVYESTTQTECALNYLDLYRKNNIEILEAYDNEKEFYIINTKKCMGYREPKWFDSLGLSNSTLDQKIETYNKYNRLDYAMVIDLKDFTKDSLDSILNDISQMDIVPKKIVIIRHINQDNSEDFQYSNLEKLFAQYNISCPWRVQTILDETLSSEDLLRGAMTTIAKQRFVSYITGYSKDIINLIKTANAKIHEELDQFVVLSDQTYKAVIFSGAVYRFAKFNNEDILANKDSYSIV